MPTLTGHCMCGNITVRTEGEPIITANCHCTDCRRTTGAAYGTLLFFESEMVSISGQPGNFQHISDRGTTLTKQFCTACGSQMFVLSDARPTWIGIRAGCIVVGDTIRPEKNIYVDSKLASTPLAPDLPVLAKM